MQIPVHISNLVPRGKRVNKNYIHIRHSYYGEQLLEVWRRLIGSYYIWKETRKLDLPNSEF